MGYLDAKLILGPPGIEFTHGEGVANDSGVAYHAGAAWKEGRWRLFVFYDRDLIIREVNIDQQG